MTHYISLTRPYQWSKNIFILAPAFFGFGQYDFDAVGVNLVLCFVAFCALASGVYVLNDIIDAKIDALHPTKKFRAIPSGAIKKHNALIFALMLICGAFAIIAFRLLLDFYVGRGGGINIVIH